MRFEYVILLEQQSAAEIRREAQTQAQAEARAAAAQGRAEAQAAAQQARVEAQQIREQAQQIREQVRQQIRIEQGHGTGQGLGQGGGGPVIMVPPTPWTRNDIPPNVVEVFSVLAIALVICVVGLPIARAIGRWIDRRGLPGASISAELGAQMNRIEQAVDTMSVEVERISEAQRFQAKLLSDREKVRA